MRLLYIDHSAGRPRPGWSDLVVSMLVLAEPHRREHGLPPGRFEDRLDRVHVAIDDYSRLALPAGTRQLEEAATPRSGFRQIMISVVGLSDARDVKTRSGT